MFQNLQSNISPVSLKYTDNQKSKHIKTHTRPIKRPMHKSNDALNPETSKAPSSSGSYNFCPYERCKHSEARAKRPMRQDDLRRHIRTKHRLEQSGLRPPGLFNFWMCRAACVSILSQILEIEILDWTQSCELNPILNLSSHLGSLVKVWSRYRLLLNHPFLLNKWSAIS